ncbi:MAG: MFS transporter [Chloroflexota bacterium]
MNRAIESKCRRRQSPALTLGHIYMFLFSLRFSEPLWVVYLRSRGMSLAMVGLFETIFHIASLTGEIPTGWIADRFGRKVSLLFGRALSILSALLMLRVTTPLGFGLAFAISAYSYNCHSGAFDALIFDDLKLDGREQEYARISGRINALYLIGCSLAAVIGGIVAQRALQLLYVLGIGVDLVALIMLLPLRERLLPEVRQRTAERIDLRRDLRELVRTVTNRTIGGIMLLWAAGGAIAASFHFYGQSYMRDLSVPLPVIGIVGMLANLLAVIPSHFAHRIEGRFGNRRPLLVGSFILPAGVLAAGLLGGGSSAVERWLIVLMVLIVAVADEALYPLFSSAINTLVPSERRATVLSMAGMVFSVVMMVVFPLVGVCGDAVGLRWGFIIIGGGLALGGALALLLRTARQRLTAGAPGPPAE